MAYRVRPQPRTASSRPSAEEATAATTLAKSPDSVTIAVVTPVRLDDQERRDVVWADLKEAESVRMMWTPIPKRPRGNEAPAHED
jgi:hypothetical protein